MTNLEWIRTLSEEEFADWLYDEWLHHLQYRWSSSRGGLIIWLKDRKTESNSEKTNNCETCKWGEWYRKGYDITMMDDECGGCCSWNSKWTPKTEPTISKMEQVDKDINVRSKDEPQTERSE